VHLAVDSSRLESRIEEVIG